MKYLLVQILLLCCLFSVNVNAQDSAAPETVESAPAEPEVDRYTAPDEIARNKEIKDLKCTICTTRCKIVQDAGRSTCTQGPEAEICNKKADDFGTSCLDQCSECR